MKMIEEYGSVAYYTELFADILADVQHDRPEAGDNLVAAFKAALISWKEYHQQQLDECERIENLFNEEV